MPWVGASRHEGRHGRLDQLPRARPAGAFPVGGEPVVPAVGFGGQRQEGGAGRQGQPIDQTGQHLECRLGAGVAERSARQAPFKEQGVAHRVVVQEGDGPAPVPSGEGVRLVRALSVGECDLEHDRRPVGAHGRHAQRAVGVPEGLAERERPPLGALGHRAGEVGQPRRPGVGLGQPGQPGVGGVQRARSPRQAPTGASASKPTASSRAAAERRTTRSACWGPTSCRPTGRPAWVRPTQTVAAGERVMLKG